MTTCVICGSRAIKRKRISVGLADGRIVRNVIAEVCVTCGERYYAPEAMKRLERLRGEHRKRAA